MAQASIPGKIKQDDTKRIIEQGQGTWEGRSSCEFIQSTIPIYAPSK